jgi:hypothetical protein
MTFDMFTPVQKDERQVDRPRARVSLLHSSAERRAARDQYAVSTVTCRLAPPADLLCGLHHFSRRRYRCPEYAKGLGSLLGGPSVPRRKALPRRVSATYAVVLVRQKIVLEIP